MSKKRKPTPMPEKPINGDLWFNVTDRREYRYVNGKWLNTTTNQEYKPIKLIK